MATHIEELLDLAEGLLAKESECAWRAAISRSYYAAYHRAVRWEEEQHIDGASLGQPGGLHQQLINRLRNPSTLLPIDLRRKAMLLGTKLQIQKERRAQADYRLDEAIHLRDAQDQVRQARQVVEHDCASPLHNRSA
ncbi:hypothetical protein [Mitsuaria sp. GD03876]|uniref:hypothetical protein n=1 Tax=Mitsuaria sp. GD03876 TaxID=2975399 RepID=UPI00244C0364|nr:hypothetical protein [Mitsuaria sp. GD03876]MDH0866649.1 hypothetical protein [Mitsuaria sp. GD03876]